MPVWCIAYDCDYDVENAPPGTSFHRILLVRNPELAKQVKFCDWSYPHSRVYDSGYKPQLVDPLLDDNNTCVCSNHFMADDYVKPVLPGFGPKKLQLKDSAVPTCFSIAKHIVKVV